MFSKKKKLETKLIFHRKNKSFQVLMENTYSANILNENIAHVQIEIYLRLYAINKLDAASKQSKTFRIGLMACLQLLYLATFALKR